MPAHPMMIQNITLSFMNQFGIQFKAAEEGHPNNRILLLVDRIKDEKWLLIYILRHFSCKLEIDSKLGFLGKVVQEEIEFER